MHITHAELRAYLDNELPAAEQSAAGQHLAGCPDCRVRLAAVAEQAARVNGRLAALAPQSAEVPRPAGIVLAALKLKQRKDRNTMLKSILTRRPVWASATAVLVLAVAFSFAPVRAWAGQFLGLFRVQQIQVLPIDTTQLSALSNDSTLAKQFSQLFADSVKITKEPGQPVVAAGAAEASQLTGFPVRLLGAGSGDPTILVASGTAFEVVINRERAQALLDEAGRSDLKLPASLDGAKISIDIPTEATVAYGCPVDSGGAVTRPSPNGADFGDSQTCVLLAQVPSPTVNTPPDFDLPTLAEIGLQFTGMSAQEAHSFSQSVDWTSTLVIPLPRNAGSYRQLTVDGVTGTLITRGAEDSAPQRYTLMWVKNGIVNALSGFGTADQAITLANSAH